uniref:Uncharacterized protein n=1 Tax=Romanomermis culicivorax TaxID=13658 RepID=A0A915HWP4_ROMCU
MNDRCSLSGNSPDGDHQNAGDSCQPDLERRLLAIRQQFQQQQADLILQYQQKYAQLTLQHVQASQQLVEEFLHNNNNQETPTSSQHFLAVAASSCSAAGGKTISDTTKEKLKEMIYNKHHHKQQQQGSHFAPQFQPYPAQWSPENELRKATSEPNLKIKGVQALRLKLMEKQQRELQETLVAGGGITRGKTPTFYRPNFIAFATK